MAGYHISKIERGVYGELSKVVEEVMEAVDANEQANQLMLLVELSDIIGAIQGYLEKHYKNTIIINDLIIMAQATRRAFESGVRK